MLITVTTMMTMIKVNTESRLASENRSRVSIRVTKVFDQGRGVVQHEIIFLSSRLIITQDLVVVCGCM